MKLHLVTIAAFFSLSLAKSFCAENIPPFLEIGKQYEISVIGNTAWDTVVILQQTKDSWYYVKSTIDGKIWYRWINFSNVTMVNPIDQNK